MSVSSPAIVMTCMLLLAPAADAAAPDMQQVAVGVRRVELRDARESLPEVHIGPGLSTTVLFDSPIRPDELVLEGRERFQRLGLSDDHLVLIPSATFRQGERLRLEVRFSDGAAPERAALSLVVDAARVDRQVELYRRPRTAESYRQEVEALKAAMARLQQEVERLPVPGATAVGGASWATTVAQVEEVEARQLPYLSVAVSAPVSVRAVWSLRLRQHWQALRVKLHANPGAWMPTGASLRDEQGRFVNVLAPWAQVVVAHRVPQHNEPQIVVVALEDVAAFRPGGYTLKLWDEGTGQSVTFEGLQVP
ncbi:DUF2381 family protein [Pyxidicoccus trucidator]|uniref:DUF2381 family protein n=1 Tax=Pyxidicoccus trucidator TaxID=2709662 RepID=UPI0013D8FFC4|nr:DUF2381 family protein [Pyxidicoccus trucidator]